MDDNNSSTVVAVGKGEIKKKHLDKWEKEGLFLGDQPTGIVHSNLFVKSLLLINGEFPYPDRPPGPGFGRKWVCIANLPMYGAHAVQNM